MKYLFVKIYNQLQVYAMRKISEAVYSYTKYYSTTLHVILFKILYRDANFSLYVTVNRISIN